MSWLYIFSVNMKCIRSESVINMTFNCRKYFFLKNTVTLTNLEIVSMWCKVHGTVTDRKDLSIRKDRSLFYHQMWYRICYTAFFLKFEMIVDLRRGTTREREGLPRFWKKMPLLVTHKTPVLSLLWNCVVASGLFSITVVASAIVMDCGFCVLMVSYHLALIPVNWSDIGIQKMRRRKVSRSSLPPYAWFCSKGHLTLRCSTEMVSILFLIMLYSAFFCILLTDASIQSDNIFIFRHVVF